MERRTAYVFERIGMVVGVVAAIGIFELFADTLFGQPNGDSTNYLRMVCGSLAGGLGAAVGVSLGRLLNKDHSNL